MLNMAPARASNAPGKMQSSSQSIPRNTVNWGVPETETVEQDSSEGATDGFSLPTGIVARFRRLSMNNLSSIQYKIAYLDAELSLQPGTLQSLVRQRQPWQGTRQRWQGQRQGQGLW